MKYIVVIGSLLLAGWWFLGQQRSQQNNDLNIRSFLNKNPKIVDVRTAQEFATGHVAGAVNIPVSEIGHRLTEFGNKSQPIGVYCRSGQRSERARIELAKAGFTEVMNLGGLQAVQQQLNQ